jgi:hypothetical protein
MRIFVVSTLRLLENRQVGGYKNFWFVEHGEEEN